MTYAAGVTVAADLLVEGTLSASELVLTGVAENGECSDADEGRLQLNSVAEQLVYCDGTAWRPLDYLPYAQLMADLGALHHLRLEDEAGTTELADAGTDAETASCFFAAGAGDVAAALSGGQLFPVKVGSGVALGDGEGKEQDRIVCQNVFPAGAATLTVQLFLSFFPSERNVLNLFAIEIPGGSISATYTISSQTVRVSDTAAGYTFIGFVALSPEEAVQHAIVLNAVSGEPSWFVDGEAVALTRETGVGVHAGVAADATFIFGNNAARASAVEGDVDEIAIYSLALTGPELVNHVFVANESATGEEEEEG